MTTRPSDSDLIRSLTSEVCPACGGRKKARQTFCSRDYYALPKANQNQLYRGVRAGYAEAVVAAMTLLGRDAFRLPSPVTSPPPAPAPATGVQMTMFPASQREGFKR